MKRILGAFLLIAAIVGACLLIPLKSNAATVDDLTFTLNDDSQSYYVADCSESASGEIVIPSKYNGLPVTSISSFAFYNCNSLTGVTIPGTITSIGAEAFKACTSLNAVYITDLASWCNMDFNNSSARSNPLYYAKNLYLNGELVTDLVIPDGVTSIALYAFCECTSIKNISIPDSVTSISEYAFFNTGYFNEKSNWEDGVLYVGEFLIKAETAITGEYCIKDNTKCIADGAFYGCKKITSFKVPKSVENIGNYAFEYCSSLTEIVIPDSVKSSIGIRTYKGCTSLTSIEITDNVTSIGEGAFESCTSLTSVTMPDSVTSIGAHAFDGCTSLSSITIPSSVMSIGAGAFDYCESISAVYIADIESWYGLDFGGYSANPLEYAEALYLNGELVTELVIPKSVTAIKNYAFSGCSSLKSVTIPEGVTSIGDSAFSNCTSLTSITIPDSVTSIGDYTFFNCTSLTGITIGNSVTSIGDSAFSNCTSLTSITIPDSVTSIGSAFSDCTSLTSITIPDGVTSIEGSTFSDCTSLTSVTIGDSVTSIGNWAFYHCTSLTSVTFGCGVNSIDELAFYECRKLNAVYISDLDSWCNIDFYDYSANPLYYAKKLYLNGNLVTDLVIPEGVETIKDGTFQNCSSLTSITIPNSVTSIGYEAFYNCTNLNSVYITDIIAWCNMDFGGVDAQPLQYAGNLYLNGDLVTDLVIPDGVEVIPYYAFSCNSLTSVAIPDSVTSIDNYAFRDCSSLTSVTIPESVTSIGSDAFEGCTSLTSITIPDSVTSIGSGAFYNTGYYNNSSNWENGVLYIGNYLVEAETSLSSNYIIKNGTKCIADSAFRYCTALTSITIPDSVTSIDWGAFSGCTALTSVTIPDSVTSIGDCTFFNCTSLTGITIGNSVTSIGDSAFSNCTSLTSITIPDSVTSIGGAAFCDCTSLTSLTISDSVTSIGRSAFIGCRNLTSITIPDSVTSIGSYAFDGCTSLTSVTIGDSVTSIGYSAFEDCTSLTSVTIPDSVTSIGNYAFSDCTSLKYVFYTASYADWRKITKGCDNLSITSAKIHYNSTGHSHSCSLESAPTEQENGKAIDTCPVCGFVNGEETLVYVNNHITAVDTKNAVVDATSNTLLLDMSACKDINEAIVEMDGYTLTTTPTSSYGFIGTGSKLQVADSTGTQVAEYTLVVRGDVNGDSVCDSIDLMLIELARHESNNVTLEGAYFAAANLAEDSEINIDDFNAVVNRAVALA